MLFRASLWIMKFSVRVKPGAKNAAVERKSPTDLTVSVRERAREGKANRAVLRAIAEYLDISVSRVRIVTGETGRIKIVEVSGAIS